MSATMCPQKCVLVCQGLKCLFTGTRQKISVLPSEPHICLDGHSIERVNSSKCLGVQVDETLSWKAHISEVIGKVAKILAALGRLCH